MRVKYLLPFLLFSFACKKEPPPPPPPPPPPAAPAPAPAPVPPPVVFSVKSVTLGKALGADKKVTEAADAFGVKDTIYASVETVGSADKAKLEAKWTFTGTKGPVSVNENALELTGLSGPTVNEFHISKKTPWPKGAYQAEILLDGASAMKKEFTVK